MRVMMFCLMAVTSFWGSLYSPLAVCGGQQRPWQSGDAYRPIALNEVLEVEGARQAQSGIVLLVGDDVEQHEREAGGRLELAQALLSFLGLSGNQALLEEADNLGFGHVARLN